MDNSFDNNKNEEKDLFLYFSGDGATYFGIVALNVVLTVLTLGLYYPWAKAAYRKYIWNETEFLGSRFVFNGTGREMFKGFIIAYVIIVGMYITLTTTSLFGVEAFFVIGFYFAFMLLIPFAIYGAWRYRVSRTSWRGIYFSFEGSFGEFLRLFLLHGLLSVLTFGIYSPWMRVKLQKFLFENTRIGNLYLDFKADGGELLGINIGGYIFSVITFGLYLPIWVKNRFNFTINNTFIDDGDQAIRLHSTLKNGEAWSTLFINGLLLFFTLGLAYPWTFMRKMDMYFNNVTIPGEFDYDNLAQASQMFDDATGDEMSDIFDLDLGF